MLTTGTRFLNGYTRVLITGTRVLMVVGLAVAVRVVVNRDSFSFVFCFFNPSAMYEVHIVCQLNPTLPLKQQLALLLPGAWACRPDLIPRGPGRWREPPGDALASG